MTSPVVRLLACSICTMGATNPDPTCTVCAQPMMLDDGTGRLPSSEATA